MTISVRLNDNDAMLFRKYAEMNGMSMSELVRRAVLERIEDDFDMKCYEKAMKEYRENPGRLPWMKWRRSWAWRDVPCAFHTGGQKGIEENGPSHGRSASGMDPQESGGVREPAPAWQGLHSQP